MKILRIIACLTCFVVFACCKGNIEAPRGNVKPPISVSAKKQNVSACVRMKNQFKGIKNVFFPIDVRLKNALAGAGFTIANNSERCDFHIDINLKAEALSGKYICVGTGNSCVNRPDQILYTGVNVIAIVAYLLPGQSKLTKEYIGKYPLPKSVPYGPDDIHKAPYAEAFKKAGFPDAMFETISRHIGNEYGKEALCGFWLGFARGNPDKGKSPDTEDCVIIPTSNYNIDSKISALGESVIPLLGTALGDSDESVRHLALDVLVKLKTPESIAGMIGGLNSDDKKLREITHYYVFKSIGWDRAIEAMISSKDPTIREKGVKMLKDRFSNKKIDLNIP